jgi:chemotaxis protein MotA
MNLSSLVGFLASFGVFGLALFSSGRDYSIFLDGHAILIVLGGTVAASCVCFSLPRVLGLLKVFVKRMLGHNKKDFMAIISEVVELSQASRKGRQAFESATNELKDPFLQDAAQILFFMEADIDHEDLRSLLEIRAETHYERYLAEADVFRVMSRFPPAFGLMGTTLGMIALLQALGNPNAKNLIGPAMSIALVATLYGIFLSNFIFIPIAENLTQQTKEDLVARRIVVEGILLIAKDKPSLFVEEKIKSFLLPSERGPSRMAQGKLAREAA